MERRVRIHVIVVRNSIVATFDDRDDADTNRTLSATTDAVVCVLRRK
jgi:hypothetical protein